jgi:hypothetical protein
MSIQVRKAGQVEAEARTFATAEAVHAAIADDEYAGTDEYLCPKDEGWYPLDDHPDLSTTDARGIYPAIVHAVVFIKILVFIAFLSLLDGHPGNLLNPWSFYVYGILIGDGIAISLAYLNRNKLSAVLLWILGIGSMPLGLFLIVAANLTKNFKYRPAE